MFRVSISKQEFELSIDILYIFINQKIFYLIGKS